MYLNCILVLQNSLVVSGKRKVNKSQNNVIGKPDKSILLHTINLELGDNIGGGDCLGLVGWSSDEDY